MKRTSFTITDFQKLCQNDRIEFLLRKREVRDNIRRSFPHFEAIIIFVTFAYSKIYNLLLYSVLGINEPAIKIVNFSTLFFEAVIVILTISFITRAMMYFQKHRQLSELHEEFLDRIKISKTEDILSKTYKRSKKK